MTESTCRREINRRENRSSVPRITATSAAATTDHQRNAPADRYAHQQVAPGGDRFPSEWPEAISGALDIMPQSVSEVGERRHHRREGNEQRNKHQHNQAGHRGAVMHKAATRVLPEATPLHFQLLTGSFPAPRYFSYLTSWRTPASVANLRIDNGVQHVNDGVEQDSQGANEDRQAEHQRVVAVKRPVNEQLADPRQAVNGFQ